MSNIKVLEIMSSVVYYIYRIESGNRYGKGELVCTIHGLREAKRYVDEVGCKTADYYQVRTKRGVIVY